MRKLITNKYFIFFVTILIIYIIVHTLFFEKDKRVFIRDIYKRSFNDTIFNAYSEKYNGYVLPVTKLVSNDTPIIINGTNDKSFYIEIATKGDILIKSANTDSFYISRSSGKTGFKLIKYNISNN
jgi:hypothetical protein